MKYIKLLALSCAMLLAPYATQAAIVDFAAAMTPSQEVPPTVSGGFGGAVGVLNTDTNEFNWTVTVTGLTGPALNGHFHGNAPPGMNASIILGFIGSPAVPSPPLMTLLNTLQGNTSGTYVGQVDLDLVPAITPDLLNGLLNGQWYVNTHPAMFPGGETRGQFLPVATVVPVPAAVWLLGSALGMTML